MICKLPWKTAQGDVPLLADPGSRVHEENTQRMKKYDKMIKHEAHFGSVLQGFSEAFVTGKFCDVKVVCKVGAAY